ncbi:hypothetical protein B0A50_06535 [Salinomyces thailandicus]|uniref:Uncharacterized protein n=1 Tax=Salinomyces thailandicus TaxID=706561 RepID=A0A4V5N3H6_9PEZI|nr:hypothetical protein B0A50_06535 [Salinomyces thailandica]
MVDDNRLHPFLDLLSCVHHHSQGREDSCSPHLHATITYTKEKFYTKTKTIPYKSKSSTVNCYTKPIYIWTSKTEEYTKTYPYKETQTTETVETKTKQVPSTYTTNTPYPKTKTYTKYEKYTTW